MGTAGRCVLDRMEIAVRIDVIKRTAIPAGAFGRQEKFLC